MNCSSHLVRINSHAFQIAGKSKVLVFTLLIKLREVTELEPEVIFRRRQESDKTEKQKLKAHYFSYLSTKKN